MKSNYEMYGLMRSILARKFARYGTNESRLIGDYILSTMDIPLFHSGRDLNETFDLTSLSVDTKKKTQVSFVFMIKNGLLSVYTLIRMLLGVFSKRSAHKQLLVTYSLTENQIKSLDRVREFLEEDRFNLNIEENTIVLVECIEKFTQTNKNTFQTRDPMLWIFVHLFSRRQKLLALFLVFLETLKSTALLQLWNFLLFKHLIIDKSILKVTGIAQIDLTLVTTQSHLKKLPAPFYFSNEYKVPKYMFWYSDNSWTFENQKTDMKFDHSRYHRDYIHTHYCWSEEWCRYLERIQVPGKVLSVGSILFYSNVLGVVPKVKESKILIFDVTPGVVNSDYEFYSSKAVEGFYRELGDVFEEIRTTDRLISVGIKNKRAINNELEDWINTHQGYFVDVDESLYTLISQCKIVIGLPLVSPIAIAKELGVAAAYFYPEELGLWDLPIEYRGIPIFRTQPELLTWVQHKLTM